MISVLQRQASRAKDLSWKCKDITCKERVIVIAGEPVYVIKGTPHNLHGPHVKKDENVGGSGPCR